MVDFNTGAANGIAFECTGAGVVTTLIGCTLEAQGTGQCKNITAGSVEFFSTIVVYSGTASTISGGTARIVGGDIQDAFLVSGSGVLEVFTTLIQSNALACVDIASGATAYVVDCVLGTSNDNIITGTGQLFYSNIMPLQGGTPIQNTVATIPEPTITGNLSFDGGTTVLNADGALWIGNNSTGIPNATNLTAGPGIGIANGPGTITISSSGGGLTWSTVTAATQAAVSNNGYIANNAGTVVITLPATSAVGDVIVVTGINNATGWSIAQNAGNQIFYGAKSTTAGTGGSLASTLTRDTVYLVCVTANADWNVTSSIGNLTVV